MKRLLLYRKDGSALEANAACKALKALPGLLSVREHPSTEAILEVDYEDERGSSTIRLNSSGDSILITWGSDAALEAALLIQRQYFQPLRIIDLDYSFDLDLSRLGDLSALKRAIAASAAS